MTNNLKTKTGFGISTLSALFLAIVPKCPICLAAYSTFFAAIGVNASILNGVRLGLSALLIVSSTWLILCAFRQGRFLQVLGLLVGTGLVLTGWSVDVSSGFKIASVLFLIVIALWVLRSRDQHSKSHQIGSCKQC